MELEYCYYLTIDVLEGVIRDEKQNKSCLDCSTVLGAQFDFGIMRSQRGGSGGNRLD